jgi:hypothetical protein
MRRRFRVDRFFLCLRDFLRLPPSLLRFFSSSCWFIAASSCFAASCWFIAFNGRVGGALV